MKTNKQITKALKSLADAINNYAESIPQPDFEKGGIEFARHEPHWNPYYWRTSEVFDFDLPRRNNYWADQAVAGGDKGIECIVDSKGKIHPLPTLEDESELKVGQWYKCEGILAVYQGEGVNTYGIYGSKGWLCKATMNWNKEWTPATDKEVEEALITEAKRRGYDKYPHKFMNEERPPCKGFTFTDEWLGEHYAIYDSCAKNIIWSSLEGQWAEIIEQPEEKLDYFGEYIKTIIHDRKLSDLSTLEMWELQDKILKELKNRI